MAVATSAAVAAGAAAHFFLGRQAPKFQRLVDVLVHALLDLVQFFLGIQEIPRDRVVHERIPVLLKIGDLLPGQRNGHLLLLLEILTLLNQFVVMGLCFVITHKSIDPLSNRLHVGLVKDRLAELARLLHHGRFFDCRLHIDFCFAIARGHLCHWTRRRNNTPQPGKKCNRRVLVRARGINLHTPHPGHLPFRRVRRGEGESSAAYGCSAC